MHKRPKRQRQPSNHGVVVSAEVQCIFPQGRIASTEGQGPLVSIRVATQRIEPCTWFGVARGRAFR